VGDINPAPSHGDDRAQNEAWRKSSYSLTNGHCVEAANLECGFVGIRDSQAAGGVVLGIGSKAWATFLAGFRVR
jgi:hypothetical protein